MNAYEIRQYRIAKIPSNFASHARARIGGRQNSCNIADGYSIFTGGDSSPGSSKIRPGAHPSRHGRWPSAPLWRRGLSFRDAHSGSNSAIRTGPDAARTAATITCARIDQNNLRQLPISVPLDPAHSMSWQYRIWSAHGKRRDGASTSSDLVGTERRWV